jgi:hypothetical protein
MVETSPFGGSGPHLRLEADPDKVETKTEDYIFSFAERLKE